MPALKAFNYLKERNLPCHPNAAHGVAHHFILLSRELLYENVRLSSFSDLPSRQKCIWLIPEMDNITIWKNELKLEHNKFQILEVCATGIIHECDASFLMEDSELLGQSYENAHKYWRGEISSINSKPEILFEGNLSIVRVIE